MNREDIEALGFEVEEVLPQVFMLPNFVSTDELDQLFKEAASYTQEEWDFHYLNEMRRNALQKFGRDDIDNLKAEGLLEITENWADKNISVQSSDIVQQLYERSTKIFDLVGGVDVTGFIVFQRLYEDTSLVSHFDQYSDKLVEWAAVLYINDDYTGGELFFPKFDNFSLKPAAGTLMIFPGTEQYEHGVHPVGKGPIRYVIPAFIKSSHPDGAMAGWGNFG
jgi:hypothetical protein